MALASNALRVFGYMMLALVMFRAQRGRLWKEYPYFYAYTVCVCCAGFLRTYLSYWQSPTAYSIGYWASDCLLVIVGSGITWEIYRNVLAPYSGVRRMARAIFYSLLVTAALKAAAGLAEDPIRSLKPSSLELARDLQVIQAVLLVMLLSLIVHYRVPMGRNLRYLLLGYGFYVGASIMTRTLRSLSPNSQADWWSFPSPIEYCATLVIWCVGMWSYYPNPAHDSGIGRDYDRISGQTLRALGRLRNHLSESWRS